MAEGPKRAKLHVPRPPDIDQGVQSFIWAILIGFVSWLFLMGVGTSMVMSTLVGAILSVVVFFAVRILGEEEPTQHRPGDR